jgi:hypothetical protein
MTMRKKKYGKMVVITMEGLKRKFGIPDHVEVHLSDNLFRDGYVFRFRTYVEPTEFHFLGLDVNLVEMSEGQEYVTQRLD